MNLAYIQHVDIQLKKIVLRENGHKKGNRHWTSTQIKKLDPDIYKPLHANTQKQCRSEVGAEVCPPRGNTSLPPFFFLLGGEQYSPPPLFILWATLAKKGTHSGSTWGSTGCSYATDISEDSCTAITSWHQSMNWLAHPLWAGVFPKTLLYISLVCVMCELSKSSARGCPHYFLYPRLCNRKENPTLHFQIWENNNSVSSRLLDCTLQTQRLILGYPNLS